MFLIFNLFLFSYLPAPPCPYAHPPYTTTRVLTHFVSLRPSSSPSPSASPSPSPSPSSASLPSPSLAPPPPAPLYQVYYRHIMDLRSSLFQRRRRPPYPQEPKALHAQFIFFHVRLSLLFTKKVAGLMRSLTVPLAPLQSCRSSCFPYSPYSPYRVTLFTKNCLPYRSYPIHSITN